MPHLAQFVAVWMGSMWAGVAPQRIPVAPVIIGRAAAIEAQALLETQLRVRRCHDGPYAIERTGIECLQVRRTAFGTAEQRAIASSPVHANQVFRL
jgi:hypothetical protein